MTSSQVQTIFNRIAPVYDQLNDWLSLGQHRIWKQMAVKWSQAKPGDNVLDLPFEDNYFDAATMGYGLRNVTDIPRSLKELHRVLKNSAKAAILDFHRPKNSQTRAFQQWYLDNLVVPIANHLGLTEEYAYISPSLDRFPTGGEQVNLAIEAGFANATHYPIASGMMGILVLTKFSA